MHVKFSGHVIPLSELKIEPGKIVGRAQYTHRPILLTSRGHGVAVVQGLMDVREGKTVSLEDARRALGIR